MKDFLKQELAVGDKVVFIQPGYREYMVGTIARFTAKFVVIEYLPYNSSYVRELKQPPCQLVKV